MKKQTLLLGIVVLLVALLPFEVIRAAEPAVAKKVLILYSFNQEYPIQGRFTKGLKDGMAKQELKNVRYFYEHLDLPAHAMEGGFQENLARFLREKYANTTPDIIIVQSKPAADFIAKYGKTAFGDVPAIITMIDQEGLKPESFPAGYTGVFGSFDAAKAVRLILDTRPTTKKVYVILGSSATEKRVQANYERQLAALRKEVEIIFLSDLPFSAVLDRIKTVEKNAAILYTFTYADKAGNTMVPVKALPDICAASPVPVYGILDTYLGTGIVGGYIASWEVLGQKVAEVAGEVLRGKIVSEFSVETYEATMYRFDWRQMKRWAIKENGLPAGSVIEYKELTFWEEYRWHIAGAITLIVVETALIFLLLVNRSRRKQAERELLELNARLEERVQQRTNELQEINATLEEEIAERQAAQEDLQTSRDQLLASEEKLRLYSEKLEESNKEIKSFANIVAHDFRSPMINLKGFSKELTASLEELKKILNDRLADLPDDDRAKVSELLDKDMPDAQAYIGASVDSLERMIDALLKLARLGRRELHFDRVDMNELVSATVTLHRHKIDKDAIAVQLDRLPAIITDRLLMEQVIGNLLDNAIKFLEDDRRGIISIYYTENDEEFVFTVEDNGRGIDACDYEKIFEVFRRAGKQDRKGEGMGLSYVKAIVRQLGGRIWCESALGMGTKMQFTVPKRPA